jgi:hypothetical protein
VHTTLLPIGLDEGDVLVYGVASTAYSVYVAAASGEVSDSPVFGSYIGPCGPGAAASLARGQEQRRASFRHCMLKRGLSPRTQDRVLHRFNGHRGSLGTPAFLAAFKACAREHPLRQQQHSGTVVVIR